MSDIAIRIEGLSKMYRIGALHQRHNTLRDALVAGLRTLPKRFRRAGRDADGAADNTIWALRDVSFEVQRGEVVGIIGRNGAGKSTLLKILSRITEPTEGRALVYGRVASLLEVGVGFHPELTGRENIYLNGAILGMKRMEINRRFDEIVAFAVIEKFLDTPVKRYSSGMYVRLAFAVAAHLEPEILLVDEVLAVGDAQFQKKCLGKMSHVAREGRTVLFVSHNMVAAEGLCDRVILLDEGKIVQDGRPDQVISTYLGKSVSTLTDRVWNDVTTAPGNDVVRIHRARVRCEDGSGSEPITVRTPIAIEFEYWNLEPGAYLNLSLNVFNEQGIVVFNTVPTNEQIWHRRPFPVGLFRSVCHVHGDLLNNGMHRVRLLVVKNQGIVVYRFEDVLVFDVLDDAELRGDWHGTWPGAVRPDLKWSTEYIDRDIPRATTTD